MYMWMDTPQGCAMSFYFQAVFHDSFIHIVQVTYSFVTRGLFVFLVV